MTNGITIAVLVACVLYAVDANAEERAFPITRTVTQLQSQYQSAEKIKILVMPGHEPSYGGTEYRSLKERDLMVELGDMLALELRHNPRFEVTVARDTNTWNVVLKSYFKREWKKIQAFIKDHKSVMKKLVRKGVIEDRSFEVEHNTAPTDVATRLYGITKWANENEYDIVLHLHLNDNPGALNHSGFAVYVPDTQFGNADISRALGSAIASRMNRYNATSTLAIENYGIVEDQDLIALGAFNTAYFATVLIEYAYIYESKIANNSSRPTVLRDFAYHTYLGVQDFFKEKTNGSDTHTLPRTWTESALSIGTADAQVYALQAALNKLGFYPPSGDLLISCPISGYMGECTKRALKAFQKSRSLTETGTLGPKTRNALTTAGF